MKTETTVAKKRNPILMGQVQEIKITLKDNDKFQHAIQRLAERIEQDLTTTQSERVYALQVVGKREADGQINLVNCDFFVAVKSETTTETYKTDLPLPSNIMQYAGSKKKASKKKVTKKKSKKRVK